MSVIARKWNFLVEFHPEGRTLSEIFQGMDFRAFIEQLKEAHVRQLNINITEEVDWDLAPMRNYFHGVVVPAFADKFNETTAHPQGFFSREEVKSYLKAKFLGYASTPETEKWLKMLRPEKHMETILTWKDVDRISYDLKTPLVINGTSTLTPEAYWRFIEQCTAYYWELFQDQIRPFVSRK